MPLTLKNLIVEAASLPPFGYAIGKLYGDHIPSGGCVIRAPSPAVSAKVKARIRWGFYERTELRMVRRHLRRDLDLIDLGSGLGVVSAQIARLVHPKCRMFCVEANPDLIPLLRDNLQANAHNVRSTVHHGAISYEGSPDRLDFAPQADHASSRCVRDTEGDTGDAVVSVPAIRLSDLIETHQIGDYVLFSDIEGAEGMMLSREKRALQSCRQLIIELHPARIDDGEAESRVCSVDQLCDLIVEQHGMRLIDRHNDVAVFER